MSCWTFFDYMLNPRRNAVLEWKKQISKQAYADFEVLLSDLAVIEKWEETDGVKPLRGGRAKGKGLLEIVFKTAGIQHRMIGFFGPEQKQFTLLIGCMHKQNIYQPPQAIETAIERKKKVENKEATLHEHQI